MSQTEAIGTAPQEAGTTTVPLPDLDVIVPLPRWIEIPYADIEGGVILCRMRPLKTDAFFALVRLLIAGFGDNLAALFLLNWSDPVNAGGSLIASVARAAPQSPRMFFEFLESVLEPVNVDHDVYLKAALVDPRIEDTFAMVASLVEAEWENILDIMGKVRGYLATIATAISEVPPNSTPTPTQPTG